MKSISKKKIPKKTILKALASLIVIGGGITYYALTNRQEEEVLGWMSSSWAYRRGIEVANSGASELTDEDILIEIDTATLVTAGKIESDCDDLRVTDSDETTAIDYWIEGGCDTSTTRVWIQIPSLPADGKTVYFYYGNASAANAELTWTGNFVMLADAACPTGWTRNTGLDTKFPYGSTSAGSTGGSSSHNHGGSKYLSSIGTPSSFTYVPAVSGMSGSAYNHTHTTTIPIGTTTGVLPPYLTTLFCNNSDLEDFTDLIALYDNASLPSNWTRFSALDNKFPMGSSTYGSSGGATTHTHTTNAVGSSNAVGYQNYGSYGGSNAHPAIYYHSHTVYPSIVAASNIPPYSKMIFAEAGSGAVLENLIIATDAVLPLGWGNFTPLNNAFPYGSSTYQASAGGTLTHTHTINTSTSGGAGGNALYATRYIAAGGHTHSGSTPSDSDSSLPPYLTVIYSKRKSSQSITLSSEETYNQTPTAPTTPYTEGSTNPTQVVDITPEFSAIYNDPDASDTSSYYEIEVNVASNFTGTVMWDSGKTSMPSTNQGSRSSDLSYAGTTLINDGSTYYWRIKFWDATDAESPWVSTAQFTMNTTPSAPTDLLTEGLTNPTDITDLTPEFSAIFNDSDTGDTGEYYEIEVNTASDFGGTVMWDSSKTSMSSTAIGNRCSDISYNGTSLSLDSMIYYWRIKFWDDENGEGSWSSTANYTMLGIPVASSLLTDGQTNPTILLSASPYFSAIYTDPDSDDSSAYEINVNTLNTFTGTILWDTDKTSTTITSGNRSSNFTYHGTPLTNSDSTYYWRIKFWDSDDNEGDWSPTAQFSDFYPSFKFEGLKMEGITIN